MQSLKEWRLCAKMGGIRLLFGFHDLGRMIFFNENKQNHAGATQNSMNISNVKNSGARHARNNMKNNVIFTF